MYQKEIIYMGLYKEGSRLGSAGFLKVENRERESRLHLKIQNIPLGISGRFPIRVHNGNGWKEINGITVQDGGGSWEERLAETSDRVIVQVMLPGEYYLEGKSKTAGEMTVREKPYAIKEESTVGETTAVKEESTARTSTAAKEESAARAITTMKEENIAGATNTAEEESAARATTAMKEQSAAGETTAMEEENAVREVGAAKKERNVEKPDKRLETILIKEELPRRTTRSTFTVPQTMPEHNLKEDKWEQILDTYEQIHPYGDDRVYVKLEPKDFVILQSKYQHLVNNSFLLHGFYNYRYIILGKEQDFYLGVPGVFYEREKMVALMFGFEAFECPGGNVRAGEFGYYLRKVEL